MSEGQAQLKLRPSDASRWTVCTMSPYYILSNADRIVEEVRDYTDEGSRAHKLAESVLTCLPSAILEGEALPGQDIPADDEMRDYVMGYVHNVWKKIKSDEDEILIEEEITCYYNPAQRGFIDAAVISADAKKVYFHDLKYGAGVSVQARHNKQAAIYARSFMDAYAEVYGFTPETLVTITIYQPRVFGEEAVRLWALTYDELVQWTDDHITGIAEDILSSPEDQAFAPSEDTCRFCPAAGFCQARLDWLTEGLEDVTPKEMILRDDEPFHPPEPESLSEAQIGAVLDRGPLLAKWVREVQDYAKGAMASGQLRVPGYKVVDSLGNRAWSDEDKALDVLKTLFKVAEVTTQKVISPTQAEKMLKKRKRTRKSKIEEVNNLIVRPVRGPTIVPEDDPRPSIALKIDEVFEDTDDDLL